MTVATARTLKRWAIFTRKGRGPLMGYDGKKFTNNGAPKRYAFAKACALARSLLKRYPILREEDSRGQRYHVWCSTNGARENPTPRNDFLDEAAKKFEDFTGHDADKVLKVDVPAVREGLVVGELDLLGYRVKREGVEGGRMVRYAHQFRKQSRPLLAVSKDGTQLLIVGGRYEFTEAGIENR
jgi:hypothetical protein